MPTPDDLRAAYEALVRLGRAKAAECAAVAAHRVERTSGSHWRITLACNDKRGADVAVHALADRLAAEAERAARGDAARTGPPCGGRGAPR